MKKFLFIIGLILLIYNLSWIITRQYVEYPLEKNGTFDLTSLMTPFKYINRSSTLWCSETTLRKRYKLEFEQLKYYRLNQSYQQPTIDRYSTEYNTSTLSELPYFYSLWKTSPILPRLITPCEHQVYIELLKTFDQICQVYGIEYMISYSTLLGSYRYHDMLPYDDDADVLIHVKYYSNISNLNTLNEKVNWRFYPRTSTYMKFYFQSSSSAGRFQWKWPFIDVFFYTDNNTHIKTDIYIEKDIIYPLVLYPIATLWLPGPRYANRFLKIISGQYYSNLSFYDWCYLQHYSHRYENEKYQQKTVKCTQLHYAYPYIRRICNNEYCNEYLMLNDKTILYVLKMIKDK